MRSAILKGCLGLIRGPLAAGASTGGGMAIDIGPEAGVYHSVPAEELAKYARGNCVMTPEGFICSDCVSKSKRNEH